MALGLVEDQQGLQWLRIGQAGWRFDEGTFGGQTSLAAPTPHAWDEPEQRRKATVLVDGNHQHQGPASLRFRQQPKLRC